MRFNKTKLLSYGIVLSMTAVSMLSTSPIASAAGNVKDEEYSYVKGLDEDPCYTRWREKKNRKRTGNIAKCQLWKLYGSLYH